MAIADRVKSSQHVRQLFREESLEAIRSGSDKPCGTKEASEYLGVSVACLTELAFI